MPEFLLETVVVSSLRFSNDPYFEDDLFFVNKRKMTADAFARKAWKTLSRIVDGEDDCSVSVVQAITLMAIYEFIGTSQVSNQKSDRGVSDLVHRREATKCMGQDWHRRQIRPRPTSNVRARLLSSDFRARRKSTSILVNLSPRQTDDLWTSSPSCLC